MHHLRVELDIFSGRPNPVWTLPESGVNSLFEKISKLPPSPALKLPSQLGYRGFAIHLLENAQEVHIQVQNGTVLISREDVVSFFADPGRKLERWLLESGRNFIDEALVNIVEASLR